MASHVFVETNWVVDVVAPVLSRNRDALDLYDRARKGEVQLHLPAVCLIEARKVVAARGVRADLNAIRSYVRDMRADGRIDENTATTSFEVLQRFEQYVSNERKEASSRI